MRQIKLRHRVYRVRNALKLVFGEGVVIRAKPLLRVYIVTYRYRNIAFTSGGRLIAIGCNPNPDKYSLLYDQRTSAAIHKKALEVEKLLHNDSPGRIRIPTI